MWDEVKKLFAWMLLACLLLSGCGSWMDGNYHSTVPYTQPGANTADVVISVDGYGQLYKALAGLVERGAESGLVSVAYTAEDDAKTDLSQAIGQLLQENPIAAYAVERIDYEIGINGGRTAFGLEIHYKENKPPVESIQKVSDLSQAQEIVTAQLDNCSAGVVLYMENAQELDFSQLVEDYAALYPQRVMEVPEVTVNLYPKEGEKQVVELRFSYQTSRATLRTMQNQVRPVFDSAALLGQAQGTQKEKLAQIYTLLMGRYDSYQMAASITPTYSLLRYGVGDTRAFAVVYAALCREAGLDCQTISGTHLGEPRIWNTVKVDGVYYHVDLLHCFQEQGFLLRTQEDMEGYVWDYSAYSVEEKS